MDATQLIIEEVKIGVAVVAFIAGLYQYVKAQNWKRSEFVAAQIKEMETDWRVQAAFMMLDWADREIDLRLSPGGTVGLKNGRVTDETLCAALLPHDTAKGFRLEEAAIRDCFDALFDRLGRLRHFVQSELVTVEELRPYLKYWIPLIAVKSADWHSKTFRVLLLNYMKVYEFDDARDLIRDFGYNIDLTGNELQLALADGMEKRPPRFTEGELRVTGGRLDE